VWKIWGRSLWIEPILVFGFEPIEPIAACNVLVRARVGGEELLLDEADQPADVVGVAHISLGREYVAVVIAGHVAFPRDLVLEEIFEPWVDAEAAEERDLNVARVSVLLPLPLFVHGASATAPVCNDHFEHIEKHFDLYQPRLFTSIGSSNLL